MPDVTIVVPAFNEEKRICSMLEGILSEFSGQQIIVVSDGSTDGTAAIVGGFEGVELIESQMTGGKGSAIAKGLRRATGDIIGFLDADGSFKPKDVKVLLSHFEGGADCVIASKWVGQGFSTVGESCFRKVSGRIWNGFVNLLLGLGLHDTQAGAKFLKKGAFDSIDCDFVSKGFEFDVELLYRLKRKGYSTAEVHVPFKDISDSTFRYSKTPGMFWNLIKIFLLAR